MTRVSHLDGAKKSGPISRWPKPFVAVMLSVSTDAVPGSSPPTFAGILAQDASNFYGSLTSVYMRTPGPTPLYGRR